MSLHNIIRTVIKTLFFSEKCVHLTAPYLQLQYFLIEEYPVAKFIDPEWGYKIDSGLGLSYPPGYIGWPPLCRSQLYPLSQGL
jgi:hypothetical protein